jgi:imidazole glycerol-phosphate synthase subunit HisH
MRGRERVALADYGAGNLRSLASALVRAGAVPVVTVDPALVVDAPLAMIAGVGHVGSAAAGLRRNGLDDAVRERVTAGRPLVGVCVGMQLFFGKSEEGGRGLGLLEGTVPRLRARVVPHMGWNTLVPTRPTALLDGVGGSDVYFAHSFAVEPGDDAVTAATVEHDGPVVAAVERDALAGVQFHPERSGAAGARVLENLLRWSRSG